MVTMASEAVPMLPATLCGSFIPANANIRKLMSGSANMLIVKSIAFRI
jgi:hypothetical protein